VRDISIRKRAELELRKREESIRAVLDKAAVVIYIKDLQGKYILINSEFEKLIHKSKEDVQGLTDYQLFPTKIAEAFRANDQKTLGTGIPLDIEETLFSEEGLRTYNSVKFPLYDADGLPYAVCGISTDITAVKEAEHRTHSTNALLRLFSRALSREEYCDLVLELLGEWSGCRCVGIRILDKYGNIPYECYQGFSKEFWESESKLSIKKDQCACIRVITGKSEPQDAPAMTPGKSFFVNNIPRFIDGLAEKEKIQFRGVCAQSGYLSVAVVPIRFLDKTVGAIHLADEREGRVPFKIVEFIELIAPLIGEAFYRYTMEKKLRQKYKGLQELSVHLHAAREEERKNIAREIHDELGQVLIALKIDLSLIHDKHADHKPIADKTESMLQSIDATIKAVKRMCTDLRPSGLDDFGLVAAIEWQATAFQQRTGIQCTVNTEPKDIELDKDRSIVIFRIFQEALTNILKHANATRVTAHLLLADDSIILEVMDNGIGIKNKELSRPQSFGLIGMRERVHPWGGKVTITGSKKRGSVVNVVIPLDANR